MARKSPKDDRGIPPLLSALAEQLTGAGAALVTLSGSKRSERPPLLEDLESAMVRSDSLLSDVIERIRRTFVLPADRGALVALALHMNETTASFFAAADTIVQHRIGELPLSIVRAVDLAARAAEICNTTSVEPFRPLALLAPAREIQRLTREARSVMRAGIAETVVETADARKTLRFTDAFIRIEDVMRHLDALAEAAIILAIRES